MKNLISALCFILLVLLVQFPIFAASASITNPVSGTTNYYFYNQTYPISINVSGGTANGYFYYCARNSATDNTTVWPSISSTLVYGTGNLVIQLPMSTMNGFRFLRYSSITNGVPIASILRLNININGQQYISDRIANMIRGTISSHIATDYTFFYSSPSSNSFRGGETGSPTAPINGGDGAPYNLTYNCHAYSAYEYN